MAQWCRERLLAAPTARLLVIVPDLVQRDGEVRRVFDEALDPDYLGRGATEAAAIGYALEGGQPLLSYAPVAAGLLTLQLLSSEVELTQLSQWLRGSFWTRRRGHAARAARHVAAQRGTPAAACRAVAAGTARSAAGAAGARR